MKKNEGKLLAQWLGEMRMSVSELAAKTGVSRQNVYYHMRREEIDRSFKERLERAGFSVPVLGVKQNDKPFDRPGMVAEPEVILHHHGNVHPVNLGEKTIMHVPLVNKYAYAGYLSGFGDAEYIHSLPAVPMIADREGRGTYMAFEVKGDSMDDGTSRSYENGDIVICRMIAQHHWANKLHIDKYDFVVVHRTAGILLKRIVRHNTAQGLITLHSLNPLYEDLTVSLDEVAQLFNVIRVEREK